MKNKLVKPIWLVLALTLAANAKGAEDNLEQMQKLYARLSDLIAVDVGSLSRVGTRLVLAPAGGYLVDPKLAPDSNPDDRRVVIGNFMDIRLAESWIISRTPDPMSSIYKAVLRDSITPRFSLTETQKLEFAELDSALYYSRPSRHPTELLNEFNNAESAFIAALQSAQTFQRSYPSRPLPADQVLRLRQAKQAYENGALGPTVREMLRRHTELQRQRGVGWLSDLQELFEANFNSEGGIGNVEYYPSYATWLDTNQTWTTITATKADLERQTHNRDTSYGGGLSAGWGLWRVGGSYQRDEKLRYVESTVSGLSLSFEVLLVNLRFPWMHVGLFDSKAWDWSPSALYANTWISDGLYNPELQGQPGRRTELLPFIPTTLVIARNVKLSANWSFDMNKFVSERTQAGGSFGWGPFSFGGRSTTSDERTYTVAKSTGTELNFKSPQIIGYFTYMPKLSPDRDPKLPWTDKPIGAYRIMTSDPLIDAANTILKDNP